MKTKREDLLKALSLVSSGLKQTNIIEQSSHFIFQDNHIITYNDSVSVVIPFEHDLKCSISSSEFLSILKGLKAKILLLKQKTNKIFIKTQSTKAELACVVDGSINDYIDSLELQKKRKWKKLTEDFFQGLKMCMFSASKDESVPYLTCLNVNKDSVYSTDDLRISKYNLTSPIKDSFLIPANAVKELLKYKITSYCLEDAWVYFKNEDGLIFCSRIVVDEYPDVEAEFTFEGKNITLPEKLIDSITTASILAEGDSDIDKKIMVVIDDGKIKVKGENNLGWIESEIEMKEKTKIEFEINPYHFSEILKMTQQMMVGEDRALFEMDNFKHLVALVN